MTSALVLFSGGQDSATCLAWAAQQFDIVETIGFDYGQRHAVELEVRKEFITAFKGSGITGHDRLGADHLIDAKNLGQIGGTAMTEEIQIEVSDTGLPNTFVPARNLYFFTLASAVGYRRGASTLVGGMCETDFSGYPDCRRVTMDALQNALSLGTDKQFEIATPLMWIDKAQTWEMASQLGGDELVQLVIENTHTCYVGDRSTRHDWGYGCGECPACDLREKGFTKWRKESGDV